MKTLIVAEKPSVGRDIASALDGPFQKRALADLNPRAKGGKDDPTFLESDDYVITWAVGHLVQLADPEEYDEKWKKWRMADLPIFPPDGFKLVPRDAKSKKQLKLIEKLLERDDIDRIVNACDAGREGELIFAYLYESVFGVSPTSPDAPKPVERLWINSMTKTAIREPDFAPFLCVWTYEEEFHGRAFRSLPARCLQAAIGRDALRHPCGVPDHAKLEAPSSLSRRTSRTS